MENWQEDLLSITDGLQSKQTVFKKIEAAARALGFEHCAYGLQVPHSICSPKNIVLNNFTASWWTRYVSADYLQTHPTVVHGHRAPSPLIWNDKVFGPARELGGDAMRHGLCVGWMQSSLETLGVAGMLTLSRSHEALSAEELASQETKMRWLVNVAHLTLSRICTCRLREQIQLTARETEVLRWSADGKTSGEISDLLALSEHTVNFHVKNAVAKLQTTNKTSAVVRAAMLGLLN